MTITTTITHRGVEGNQRVVSGYSTNDSTGGEITTGLNYITEFSCNALGSLAVELSVNETFPLEKGDVTIVTENGVAVNWKAWGH